MAPYLLPFSTRDSEQFRLNRPTKLIRWLALSCLLVFFYLLYRTATAHTTKLRTIPLNNSYYDDTPPMDPVCLYEPGAVDETNLGRTCVDTRQLKRLIMVPGHAVFVGKNWRDVAEESSWFLHPYQKGQLPTMLTHIAKGVQLAANDPTALVVFSGGETRPAAGPRTSEGQSYWMAAEAQNWFEMGKEVSLRATTEEYAKDSFENLLFSICRFREYTGSYPEKITVVGFELKKSRYQNLHRAALRFPESAFEYIGIDPPDLARHAGEGETQNAVVHFQENPYGCTGALNEKRRTRNPYRRRPPYQITCPEIKPLLRYCPADGQLFPGALPWDKIPRIDN